MPPHAIILATLNSPRELSEVWPQSEAMYGLLPFVPFRFQARCNVSPELIAASLNIRLPRISFSLFRIRVRIVSSPDKKYTRYFSLIESDMLLITDTLALRVTFITLVSGSDWLSLIHHHWVCITASREGTQSERCREYIEFHFT